MKIIRSVKKLDKKVVKKILLHDMMSYTEKRGQIKCYLLIYENDEIQYMITQEVRGKTYTNYYSKYSELVISYRGFGL